MKAWSVPAINPLGAHLNLLPQVDGSIFAHTNTLCCFVILHTGTLSLLTSPAMDRLLDLCLVACNKA